MKYAMCYNCRYNIDNTCVKHEAGCKPSCDNYEDKDAMMNLQKSLP